MEALFADAVQMPDVVRDAFVERLDRPAVIPYLAAADLPQSRLMVSSSFIDGLRRRKLFQWTAAYLATAAALFGTLESVSDVFDWRPGMMRAVFFMLLGGLCVTIVLAWYHGEKGRQRVSTLEVLLITAALLLAGGAAGVSLVSAGSSQSPVTPQLLVLPFDDDGGDDQRYLADGIADELRQRLSSLADVRVTRSSAAATAVRDPRGGGRPGSRAGADLTHVLDGTVQRDDAGLRITARLTDAAGDVVWRDRYDLAVHQLLDVEDRIAAGVARALYPERDRADVPRGRGTRDPVAHDHYLRGEHALKQRTPASVIQAISEYRAAAASDPQMTAAIAREAYAYALYVDWGWTYPGLSTEELMRRATSLADRAVQQDSLAAEAWLARAYVLAMRDPQRMRGAPDAFARAVALDPTNPEAQHQYGQTLMVLGRYAEARAAYHAALAVEPERPLTIVPLSAIALREGDRHAAQRWADSAVALAPSAPYAWTSRAQLRLEFGDAAGARADAEQALRIDPSYALPAQSALAGALHVLGDEAGALQALERAHRALVQPDRPSSTEAYYLGAALLLMDRRAEALDIVMAARPRGAWLWFYVEGPTFDALRGEPRFTALISEIEPR
jgi:TolB-like protein/tetratricopeptide (TPR) repeat protein